MEAAVFSVPIRVRWRDLDAFRHVNNAAFVSYLEEARSELWRSHFQCTDAMDIPFVIARIEIDYKRPIHLYDEVVVSLRPTDIRPVSFAFDYTIAANRLAAATARTTQVCVRPTTGRPVRVPADLRQGLADLLSGGEAPSA